MKKYRIDILAITATKWRGRGSKSIAGYEAVYSGVESGRARADMAISLLEEIAQYVHNAYFVINNTRRCEIHVLLSLHMHCVCDFGLMSHTASHPASAISRRNGTRYTKSNGNSLEELTLTWITISIVGIGLRELE